MEPVIHKFRNAVLGGFNRRDVLDYIEKTAQESGGQVERLTKQLAEATGERDKLSVELSGLKSQSGDLAAEEAKVRSSLEESTRTLTRVRGELQVAQGQLTIAKKELADLQAKVAQLEPLAQRYEALKDRVATVELDAHRKAQATIEEASVQIEELKQDTAQWVDGVSRSYETIRDEVRSCADTIAAMCSTFDAAEETYQTLKRQTKEKCGAAR